MTLNVSHLVKMKQDYLREHQFLLTRFAMSMDFTKQYNCEGEVHSSPVKCIDSYVQKRERKCMCFLCYMVDLVAEQ